MPKLCLRMFLLDTSNYKRIRFVARINNIGARLWNADRESLPALYLPNCSDFTFRRGDNTNSLKLYLQKLSTSSLTAASIWMTWSCSPWDMVIMLSGTRPLVLNSAKSNWVWWMPKSQPGLSSLLRILDLSLFRRLGQLRVTLRVLWMQSWPKCIKSGCRKSSNFHDNTFNTPIGRLLYYLSMTTHLSFNVIKRICTTTHNPFWFFCTNSFQMALNVTMSLD